MGLLSLDRRIDAEVLDARGGLAVTTGGTRVQGTLKEVPQLFVEGAHLAIALQVGGSRFEAVCRVLDQAVVATPGSHIQLEVLKASPADISGIEAFDLVPLTPMGGTPMPLLDDEPLDDDEPTGVVGTLKEMPVSEIVQTLAQGGKDALVEVKPKGSEGGLIGIEKGRVVYAKTETRLGELAFFELFSAHRGAFRIRYGRHAEVRNIQRDTTFLLLEGARVLDERMSGKNFQPPVMDLEEAGATLIDEPRPEFRSHPGGSGPFSRFFDEAGVTTPPPLPETQRFMSLALSEIHEIAELDDVDHLDSDRTTRERKTPAVG